MCSDKLGASGRYWLCHARKTKLLQMSPCMTFWNYRWRIRVRCLCHVAVGWSKAWGSIGLWDRLANAAAYIWECTALAQGTLLLRVKMQVDVSLFAKNKVIRSHSMETEQETHFLTSLPTGGNLYCICCHLSSSCLKISVLLSWCIGKGWSGVCTVHSSAVMRSRRIVVPWMLLFVLQMTVWYRYFP